MRLFQKLTCILTYLISSCQSLTIINGHVDNSLLPLSVKETASTFVALKDLHYNQVASTSLTKDGEFTFYNITTGAYLVHLESIFLASKGIYRVDIAAPSEGSLEIGAHLILPGHDAVTDLGPQVQFPLSIEGTRRDYLQQRPKFSLLSVLKSPMILMSLVSLILVFVFPKLIENMDPETLEQFHEHQNKRNESMEKVTNFDMASYMAERSTKKP